MGWASYNEDIESRAYAALRGRSMGDAQPASPSQPNLADVAKNPAQSSSEPGRIGEFTIPTARPLPVFILADVSGSMAARGKIDALNEAIREMIAAFAEEEDVRAEIHVCVITFGGEAARIDGPLAPASAIVWEDMSAEGRTWMGGAFSLVQQLIEDRQVVPSRAYRPTIVLVSDGAPTDDWRGPLDSLLASERGGKAARFAMAIGEDADREKLQAFLADDNSRVFEANEAREIHKFFRWVTMSVTLRSRSTTPDVLPSWGPTDLNDLEF